MLVCQIAWDQFDIRFFAQTPHNYRIQNSPKYVLQVSKNAEILDFKEKIEENKRKLQEI